MWPFGSTAQPDIRQAAENAEAKAAQGMQWGVGKMLSSVSESMASHPQYTPHMIGRVPFAIPQKPGSLTSIALGKLGTVANPITYIPSLNTLKSTYQIVSSFAKQSPWLSVLLLGVMGFTMFTKQGRSLVSEYLGGAYGNAKKSASLIAWLMGNFVGNVKDYLAEHFVPRSVKHGFRGFQSAVSWMASKAMSPVRATLSKTLSGLMSTWPISMFGEASAPQNALDPRAKYAGGDAASFDDPKKMTTGIAKDLKALGKAVPGNARTLMEVGFAKGKPQDDKKMTMEKMIALTASLPATSKARKKLTCTIIDTLWDSLEHPPLSYYGEKFQYRTADGSYNNVMYPDLGRAGTPYARSIRSQKRLHGVRPDPGVLFDLLMARPDEEDGFKENPAGISSVLFYHASIIIHDIFRTNRLDSTISDTSSYLDLAPLYGSSTAEQAKIRTFSEGMLKPDTFHEKRLLGQPPGVNVMLVFYSRFHNYVADILLKINEGGRFTLRNDSQEAKLKQDNDLFQTARLIVGGLYINICLHDYLRGLTNSHHSATDWTLDPRIEIGKEFSPDGVPRGMGNQVSAEFNLLYRFHSVISQRDERWLNEFLGNLFPGIDKPLSELSPQELMGGLLRYEASIDPDPSKRTFGNLKRGPDGKFKDEDLVRVMKESIEDPAGLFGARMVPKALRVVEILGILQARKWGMASLNEFRDFFGLKRHESFEDITDNQEIQYILRNLYDHPDMVELYPGLFIEDAKPRMDPGCGGCPPYTVGRAVFSDAVTLVRSDRFYTLDYTVHTLTNWGMSEVQQDYKTLGGSMLYKLIQRAVPGWFPYNSLHVMQPMFTKNMNREIAKELGTYNMYTEDDPSPPGQAHIIVDPQMAKQILLDQRSFAVPWAKAMNEVFPGVKDYSTFMLGGDKATNTAMRNMVGDALYSGGALGVKKLFFDYVVNVGKECLREDMFNLGHNVHQIDIVRDLAITADTRLMADLFCLDLVTPENPNGSLSVPQLYQALLDFRIWGFNNNDPAKAWNRRRRAAEAATILTETTEKMVRNIKGKSGVVPTTFLNKVKSWFEPRTHISGLEPQEGGLRWYGEHIVQELLMAKKSVQEISEIMWLTAVAGVGVPVAVFTEVLQYFLTVADPAIWRELQKLAADDNESSDAEIRKYVQEAQRITSTQRDVRFVKENATVGNKDFKRGEAIVLMLGHAGRHPSVAPEPEKFRLDRPRDAYMAFGYGPHECLGREITMLYCTALLKVVAGLKNLRPAPGAMGELKSIQVGTEKCYLTADWAHLTFDPTTWKLHCDGYGMGSHPRDKAPAVSGLLTGLDTGSIAASLVGSNPDLLPAREDMTHTCAGDIDTGLQDQDNESEEDEEVKDQDNQESGSTGRQTPSGHGTPQKSKKDRRIRALGGRLGSRLAAGAAGAASTVINSASSVANTLGSGINSVLDSSSQAQGWQGSDQSYDQNVSQSWQTHEVQGNEQSSLTRHDTKQEQNSTQQSPGGQRLGGVAKGSRLLGQKPASNTNQQTTSDQQSTVSQQSSATHSDSTDQKQQTLTAKQWSFDDVPSTDGQRLGATIAKPQTAITTSSSGGRFFGTSNENGVPQKGASTSLSSQSSSNQASQESKSQSSRVSEGRRRCSEGDSSNDEGASMSQSGVRRDTKPGKIQDSRTAKSNTASGSSNSVRDNKTQHSQTNISQSGAQLSNGAATKDLPASSQTKKDTANALTIDSRPETPKGGPNTAQSSTDSSSSQQTFTNASGTTAQDQFDSHHLIHDDRRDSYATDSGDHHGPIPGAFPGGTSSHYHYSADRNHIHGIHSSNTARLDTATGTVYGAPYQSDSGPSSPTTEANGPKKKETNSKEQTTNNEQTSKIEQTTKNEQMVKSEQSLSGAIDFSRWTKEDFNKIQVCTTLTLPDGVWQPLAESERENQTLKSFNTWRVGRTLKIRFVDGTEKMHEKFKEIAKSKEKYGNFKFEFIKDGYAEIRVSFDKSKGIYSYIGTDCATVGQAKVSTNCGQLNENSSDEEWFRVVSHLLGHTLGIAGPLPCPASEIEWNRDLIRAYYRKMYPEFATSDEVIDNKLSRTGKDSSVDPRAGSSMTEAVPPEFTLDDSYCPLGVTEHNQFDDFLLKQMYPFNNQGDSKPSVKSNDQGAEQLDVQNQTSQPASQQSVQQGALNPSRDTDSKRRLGSVDRTKTNRNSGKLEGGSSISTSFTQSSYQVKLGGHESSNKATWITIVGDPEEGADRDYRDESFVVDLPFAIPMFGEKTSRIGVDTNGVITMLKANDKQASKARKPRQLPDKDYGTALFPMWDDMCVRKGSKQSISYIITGLPDEESVIFSFELSRKERPADEYRYLVEFSKKTPDVILVHYSRVPGGAATATIGAQRGNSKDNILVSRNGSRKIKPGTNVIFDTKELDYDIVRDKYFNRQLVPLGREMSPQLLLDRPTPLIGTLSPDAKILVPSEKRDIRDYAGIELPFEITVFGETTNTITVTKQGNIVLGDMEITPDLLDASPTSLPNKAMGTAIFPYWPSNVAAGQKNGVFLSIISTSSKDGSDHKLALEFIVNEQNSEAKDSRAKGQIHYQVVFSKKQPNILEINYFFVDPSCSGGENQIIGVQGKEKSQVLQYSFRKRGAIKSGLGIRYDTTPENAGFQSYDIYLKDSKGEDLPVHHKGSTDASSTKNNH